MRGHCNLAGVICTNPERLDVVSQAQTAFGLKPTLPDFYNILLERPRQDPKGYGEAVMT